MTNTNINPITNTFAILESGYSVYLETFIEDGVLSLKGAVVSLEQEKEKLRLTLYFGGDSEVLLTDDALSELKNYLISEFKPSAISNGHNSLLIADSFKFMDSFYQDLVDSDSFFNLYAPEVEVYVSDVPAPF